jgi:hypothetical protein
MEQSGVLGQITTYSTEGGQQEVEEEMSYV